MTMIAQAVSRQRKVARVVRGGLATVFSVLLGVSFLVVPASAANAVSATSFNPGNIISDGAMYNGSAMTAAEVQQFLNSASGNCIIGTSGYAAGSTRVMSNGAIRYIANTCLPNYAMDTVSKVGDAYCGAYTGQENESAAQIIAKVGAACNISQKVLLVMLQKEQSLITDTWPYTRQYDAAMGYNCPDSGPNNSANCDPAYFGFQNQVWSAARQLQRYKALPNNYGYKAGQYNTIKWSPTASCGTSSVYIENAATAGLYIYTPYRPNQAALNAGWGTGDSCSSYGNRNFFLYYSNWFGAPVLRVDARFDSLYASLNGTLGEITGNATAIGGGYRQELERGTMYWHPATGAQVLLGGVRSYYNGLGGLDSFLGFPASGEILENGGVRQEFLGGTVYWSPSSLPGTVYGGIRNSFNALGGTSSFLGFPVGGEVLDGGGVRQEFEGGTAYWSPWTEVGFVQADVKAYYLSIGGPSSFLGFPIGTESVFGDGVRQDFQAATLYWKPNGVVGTVYGGIRTDYNALGGPSSFLGFPVGDEVLEGNGVRQEFEGGTAYWFPVTGVSFLSNDVKTYYESVGGLTSFLGAPRGWPSEVAGGVRQDFQTATVYWKSNEVTGTVYGGIRTDYTALGGPSSFLGFPVGDEVLEGSGVRQEFEGGTAYWFPATGVGFIGNDVNAYYLSVGGPTGFLGAPKGRQASVAGGVRQEFQVGTLYWKSDDIVGTVYGGIRTDYHALGGPSSFLGFPIGSEVLEGVGVRQEFEGGTARWTPYGGIQFTRKL